MDDNSIDLSMYKGFIYSSLRNKDVVYELEDETVINLEKKRLKSLEESSTINWFKWWRFLSDNPDNLNVIDKYWLFNSVNEMNGKTKDSSFYKKIGYTYVNGLKKCNQDHEDMYTSEILKSIESEIDCLSLTTNGLYNSLLRNEYFNKLIKFNIDEINEIRINLEKRKNQLKNYCKVEFLIDEFSTNNRFENFMKNGVYEPFFWNSDSYSNNEKKIISSKWMKKINELVKLENETDMNLYINDLLSISESLKNNQLHNPEDSNIFSKRLKEKREIHKKYIEDDGPIKSLIQKVNIPDYNKKILENRRLEILHGKIPEPQKPKEPKGSKDPEKILFDKLKKEIENIDKDNAKELLDNEDLDDKIYDANLSQDKIEELQKVRKDRLNKFISDKIDEFENKIKISKTQGEIDDLIDDLKDDKILSTKQKEDISTLIQDKLSEISQSTKPKPGNVFDELKKEIENIDKDNADKLLDNEKLDKKINNANLSDDDIDELQEIRREKLFNFRDNEYNKFDNQINTLKTEDDLNDMNDVITNNRILSDKQKQELQDEILKIKEKLFPITPPVDEDLIFNEIKNLINDVDTDVTSEVKNLLDNKDIDKKIKDSKISYNKINELQTLRKNKLDESRKKSFNELNKNIDRAKKEDLDKIKTLINDDEILLDKEKQNLVDRITEIKEKINEYEKEIKDSKTVNEVDDIFNKLSTDKTLPSEIRHEFIKIQEEKKTEILQKENNEKYDIIKEDIDKFLTPETLDKYVKDKIDSLDDKYLTNNRNKKSLNEIHTKKRDSLIETFKKEENENYNSLIDDIKNCKDSNLLTAEFYNDIYRNIEDLDEKYLASGNTKAKLHELRKDRMKTLENENI
ncbi:9224_t:CDS:1 [Scutellospora calospora]|uniref:9224_t:CDS:1 n=1 Tax=Scutellospora calospora TaxID=85575 RepID=A0ACA9K1L5_9GLOM|nr:9224_t:CDS:1 [Scutellospora calospora]